MRGRYSTVERTGRSDTGCACLSAVVHQRPASLPRPRIGPTALTFIMYSCAYLPLLHCFTDDFYHFRVVKVILPCFNESVFET